MSRRGRPPKVVVNGENTSVKVKGRTFTFKVGENGRLYEIGRDLSADPADRDFAKTQVVKAIEASDTE